MIEIRKGGIQDVESFIALLRYVKDNMEHKEWFFLDPAEEIREMMADGTMELWVAMDGDRLAGAFDILHPGMESYNYGYALDLSEAELLRVINMDTAAVHPDYRGQGLQKKLMEFAQREFKGNHILLCTVHPENQFSLRNVLSQGYRIVKTVPMYGSVRHVLRKDIE